MFYWITCDAPFRLLEPVAGSVGVDVLTPFWFGSLTLTSISVGFSFFCIFGGGGDSESHPISSIWISSLEGAGEVENSWNGSMKLAWIFVPEKLGVPPFFAGLGVQAWDFRFRLRWLVKMLSKTSGWRFLNWLWTSASNFSRRLIKSFICKNRAASRSSRISICVGISPE